MFARHIVKMDPDAFRGRKHALRAEDHAVRIALIQLREDLLNLVFRILLWRLLSPGCKYLIRVMMMVVMIKAAAA